MDQASQKPSPTTAGEETVAIAQHRREITKRMTRKQTELRLDALATLAPPGAAAGEAPAGGVSGRR